MHDIWNPWHGCIKKSEGCEHCFMYALDKQRGQDGRKIFKVKNNFDYPLQRRKDGHYKVQSGEMLRVCLTSDFFLEEADPWRKEAWGIIRKRPDVVFWLLTKRPERVAQCLPENWGDGWDNVFFNVTVENQKRADERAAKHAAELAKRGLAEVPACRAQRCLNKTHDEISFRVCGKIFGKN
ncbi:MAG: DUF5131 family protein, partial [bacterium]